MGIRNNPKTVVIHCSATPDDRDIDIDDIRKWHLAKGWSDIGYHWVIKRNGIIQAGRPESLIGAHVHGHNTNSLGICLVGNVRFNDFQITSLVELLLEILDRYSLSVKNIKVHNEFTNGKTCPNFSGPMVRKLMYYALK